MDVAALRSHADHISMLRGDLASARAAAARVDLGPDTFGEVGVLIVGPCLGPLQAVGECAIDQVDHALSACAAAVREVADMFDAVDAAVRQRFEQTRLLLGPGPDPYVFTAAPPVRSFLDRLVR